MEFNLGPKTVTLVGNWYESRVLEAVGAPSRLTGAAVKTVPTADRVLPTTSGPAGRATPAQWCSEAAAAGAAVMQPGRGSALPPRAALLQHAIATDAAQWADAQMTTVDTPVPLTTTTSSTYMPYSAGMYRPSTRRPLSPDRAGGGGKTVTGPGDPGASAVPIQPTAAPDDPVTIYTTSLPAGVFPMTAVKAGHRPMAKSTTFTNPIDEAYRSHAETNERPDVLAVTYGGSSVAVGAGDTGVPGGEVTLHPLFHRLLRRVGEAAGVMTGLTALLRHLHGAAADAAGETLGATLTRGIVWGGDATPPAALRAFLHERRVPIPAREVECIIAACDVDGRGVVSIHALGGHMRQAMPHAATDHLTRLFRRLAQQCDRDDESIPIHTLAASMVDEAAMEALLAWAVEIGLDAVSLPDLCLFYAIAAASDDDHAFAHRVGRHWGHAAA